MDSSYRDSAVASVAFKRPEMKFEAKLAASVILWPKGLRYPLGQPVFHTVIPLPPILSHNSRGKQMWPLHLLAEYIGKGY